MKIDSIEGGSQVSGYKGWIELDSVYFSVDRDIPMAVGRSDNRETSLPLLSEVTITKLMDKSSNHLFAAACGSKKSLDTVQIHLCTNGPNYQPYVKLTLNNVMPSGYEKVMAGNSVPSELISLTYTKITHTQVEDGSPVITGFDLITAKTV